MGSVLLSPEFANRHDTDDAGGERSAEPSSSLVDGHEHAPAVASTNRCCRLNPATVLHPTENGWFPYLIVLLARLDLDPWSASNTYFLSVVTMKDFLVSRLYSDGRAACEKAPWLGDADFVIQSLSFLLERAMDASLGQRQTFPPKDVYGRSLLFPSEYWVLCQDYIVSSIVDDEGLCKCCRLQIVKREERADLTSTSVPKNRRKHLFRHFRMMVLLRS